MKGYILVINYVKNKPVALVRSEYGVATEIVEDKSAERVFINDDPRNINRKYGFTLLGQSSCHPDIGYYIDSLGPVLDKDEKWKRTKQRTAKAKKARELSKDDLVRIDNMLSNGVSQSKVAEAMGVSQSFIQRNNRRLISSGPSIKQSC